MAGGAAVKDGISAEMDRLRETILQGNAVLVFKAVFTIVALCHQVPFPTVEPLI
jgi:hypothetical protein